MPVIAALVRRDGRLVIRERGQSQADPQDARQTQGCQLADLADDGARFLRGTAGRPAAGLDPSTGVRWYYAGGTAWLIGDAKYVVQITLPEKVTDPMKALDLALRL